MGKYSNPGMGAGQYIFSVGSIPRVSGHGRRRPPRSTKSKLRVVRVYAAQYGLFLNVGKLKNGEPLLYPIKDIVGFFKKMEEAMEGDSFGNAIIHRMYGHIGRQRHFVMHEGRKDSRKPLWISIKQKDYLFRNLVQQGENKNGDDTRSQGQEKSSRSSEGV